MTVKCHYTKGEKMKCIVCGEEAECVLVYSKAFPLKLSVANFTYGGSMCEKCAKEHRKKAEEEYKLIQKTWRQLAP